MKANLTIKTSVAVVSWSAAAAASRSVVYNGILLCAEEIIDILVASCTN